MLHVSKDDKDITKEQKNNHKRLYRIMDITTKAEIKFLQVPPDIHEGMIITHYFESG